MQSDMATKEKERKKNTEMSRFNVSKLLRRPWTFVQFNNNNNKYVINIEPGWQMAESNLLSNA